MKDLAHEGMVEKFPLGQMQNTTAIMMIINLLIQNNLIIYDLLSKSKKVTNK